LWLTWLTAAIDDLEKNLPETLGSPLRANVQDHYAEEAALKERLSKSSSILAAHVQDSEM